MILVRSERRLPPTKGISVGWEVASEARRVIQVRVVLGYVSVEPWDPTRRVFPLPVQAELMAIGVLPCMSV